MDSLEYSIEALEAKALFYEKQTILFVEGIDDPLFWNHFIKLLNLDVHIEDVGGCENLEKIIDLINVEDANIFVAIDRDYLEFTNMSLANKYNHKRVLKTYGHSIENTLYHPIILNEVIKGYVRITNFDETDEIGTSINKFERDVLMLLVYDIISNQLESSKKVLGDSCVRYLKNAKSIELCLEKINNYIHGLNLVFPKSLISEIENRINLSNKRIFNIIKGHFLTSFVINIIRGYVKKIRNKDITLNTDNLYAAVIDKIFLLKNLDEYN